jgi:putative acetyltransferase
VSSQPIHIRRYQPGEAAALREIFHSAVHLIACRDYTADQVNAWAPRNLDPVSGYIDHFYDSGLHPRRGIGTLLMTRLLQEAEILGARFLTADVSKTAQPLFEKFGFVVVEQRYPECFGVVVPNAHMRRG